MMPSLLVCIGDVHVHAGPRNTAVLQALDQIIREAQDLGPQLGGFVIAGDLFDARSSIENRNALAERLIAMATLAPIFIVYGNHDLPGDLDIFAKLQARWPITVLAAAEVITATLATGAALTVFGLPYPHPGGLVAAGVAPADLHAKAHEALDAIFLDAGAKLDAARRRGDLTLFMMHGTVDGAVASTGQPQFGGTEIAIDEALLVRLGDCPKVANHIHRGQTIAGVVIPGSICRLNNGEIEPKRYVILEFDSPDQWRFVERPVDVAPLYYVEGEFARGELTYRFVAGPGGALQERPSSVKGCEVRARISFPQSERAFWEMGKAQLLADFADAKLYIDPRCVPDRLLRAPEVAAARTLTEKVRAWASLGETALPDLTLAHLARLERLDEEQLLVEIDREIARLVNPAEVENCEAVA